jgi:hypothetical protein
VRKIAGGNCLVPALHHAHRFLAPGAVDGLAAHGGLHVEGAGADAHRDFLRRCDRKAVLRLNRSAAYLIGHGLA